MCKWSSPSDSFGKRPARVAAWAARAGAMVLVTACLATGRDARAATFEVNQQGDEGEGTCTPSACTLRQAIKAANATAAADRIDFAIGCGAKVIEIGSPLIIEYPVVIDGTTQPRCKSSPTRLIELRGPGARVFPGGFPVPALWLHKDNDGVGDRDSGGSEIKGLSLNGFSGGGLVVLSSNNSINSNRIGVDPSGRFARPNLVGMHISGDENAITGNVVSGNLGRAGIRIEGDRNRLENNLIGVAADGELALGNENDGIAIVRVGFSTRGNGNLIGREGAGNTIAFNRIGVAISGGVSNTVLGNSIHDNEQGGLSLGPGGGNDGQVAPVLLSARRTFAFVTPAATLDTSVANLDTPVVNLGTPVGNLDGASPKIPRAVFRTTFSASLAGAEAGGFVLDLYGSEACHPSGVGEGQDYLGSAPVPRSGRVVLETDELPSFLSLVARAPSGDTSIFSNCMPVTR